MIHSNKATRAENQQERLIKTGWVVGFVDGEGCFTIGFIKQPDRPDRKGYRLGFQPYYELAVTQGVNSKSALLGLKKFFGVGELYINKRYDNHKEHLYRYTVRRRADLLNVIIPFFEKYQLQTQKRKSFEIFSRVLHMIERKLHLQRSGLIKIMRMTEGMNQKKRKGHLIKILRNQTPKLAVSRLKPWVR
jgi:hypothetical protein